MTLSGLLHLGIMAGFRIQQVVKVGAYGDPESLSMEQASESAIILGVVCVIECK
jgi:hypothetical protein